MAALAGQKGTPLLVCQLVGGQDGWVFAGQSFAVDGQGRLVARARAFSEDFLVVDLSPGEGARPGGGEEHSVLRAVSPANPSPGPASAEEELYQALVLGTRDYAVKNGFRAVGLGLSGGLDSALVAAIAADALGPGAVTGVYMPSRYSSTHSRRTPGNWPAIWAFATWSWTWTGCSKPFSTYWIPSWAAREERPGEKTRRKRIFSPDPGNLVDGPLQQVGLARPHCQQQERSGRRLHHLVRGHGGRAGGFERRAQDLGLSFGPVPQCLGRPGRDPPADFGEAPFRGIAAGSEGYRFRCRNTGCSIPSCRLSWKRIYPWPTSPAGAWTRNGAASGAHDPPERVQAETGGRPASRFARAFGKDWRMPITNGFSVG